MAKWMKTKHEGVRFREHPTRKFGVRRDRYYAIRYYVAGERKEESLGWETDWQKAELARKEEGRSTGRTLEQEAVVRRAGLLENQERGTGPRTMREAKVENEARREAEAALQKEQNAKEEIERRENVLFGDLIDNYVKWAMKNKKSQRMDESRCRIHIKPALGRLRARDIDTVVLTTFREELTNKLAAVAPKKNPDTRVGKSEIKRTLSAATIKHCMVLIRQIFNHSIAMGDYVGKNPIAKGSIPRSLKERLVPNKLDNQRLRFLSHDEADSLLQELKRRSQQTHDMALLSLRTGARFNEVASLEWQHVDFFNERIHLKGKNGQTRPAFMTPDLKEVLLARSPGKPHGLVFNAERRGGGQVKQEKVGQVSWAFWRAVDKLKFNDGITDPKQKIVFHSLRHSFGSWLAQQGTSIFIIKELMGHEKIEMTMRYAHLLPDTKREAVMQMYNVCSSGNVIPLADRQKA